MQKRLFLSYNFPDRDLVLRIHYLLATQADLLPFSWDHDRRAGDWRKQVGKAIDESHFFVLLIGGHVGDTQSEEIASYEERAAGLGASFPALRVLLPNGVEDDPAIRVATQVSRATLIPRESGPLDAAAWAYARQITECCEEVWTTPPGLPFDYPFDYEKDIISAYQLKALASESESEPKAEGESNWFKLLQQGVPPEWPVQVRRSARGGVAELARLA